MLHIMLVDDSSTMRKILKSIISPLGNFEFIECKNGEEALKLIESGQKIDCIFLDINMPVMDGLEFIDALKDRKIFDSQNIILTSTEVCHLDQKYLDDLNLLGVIPKPFKKNEIEAMLVPLLELARSKNSATEQQFKNPILIIDDSLSIRKILKKQLSNIGCTSFFEASDAKEGLNIIANNFDELSLIFLDLHMPQMDGSDLLEHLKNLNMIDYFHIILISTDTTNLASVGSIYPNIKTMAKPFKQKDIDKIVIPILQKINPQTDSKDKVIEENRLAHCATIQDCLSNYFYDIEELIKKNIFFVKNKKKFDFIKFKTFLDLAIENLTKLDAKFIDATLKTELSQIGQFEKIYKSLGIVTGTQKRELFKNIFLNHQEPYNELLQIRKKHYEEIKIETEKFEKAVKILQLHQGSKEKRKQIESYKLDIEQKLIQLQETYKQNLKSIDDFERAHYNDFEKEYNVMRKRFKDAITSILNAKYYQLNKLIWRRANKLGTIQAFCYKNKLRTPLDAREFLKHFLKTAKIAYDDNLYKELLQVLHILQKQKREVVVIVYENIKELESMKNALQQYDKNLIVVGFTNYNQLLKEKKLDIDLIIIDFQMKNLDKHKEAIKKRYSDSNFLLLFKTKSTQEIFDAISCGLFHPTIKNYLNHPKYLNSDQLTQKVSQLL